MGLYTTIPGAAFSGFSINSDAHSVDLGSRWSGGAEYKYFVNNGLSFCNFPITDAQKTFLKGLRLDKFQATFSLARLPVAAGGNGQDVNHTDFVTIYHNDSAQAPTMAYSGTTTSSAMPAVTSTSLLWVRVTQTGAAFSVKCISAGSVPSDATWSSTSPCLSSSAVPSGGGFFGFGSAGYDFPLIGDLTIQSGYNAATGAFGTTELEDHFTTDTNGYTVDPLTYDDNGNLTYDGLQAYTYDAWNRLKTVAHAYTVSIADGGDGTTVHTGHVFENIGYDATGRRITKAISGTGAMDAQYHSYYSGQSVVEERLGTASGTGYGPGLVIKQQVWGLGYVDEAVQTAVNSDPMNTSHQTGAAACDRLYWLMQDANYNVLGVVNSSGTLVERYEYSAYGQRQVFISSGVNDPGCYTPSPSSSRVVTSGSVVEPYGINEVGHQGLVHDEETNLVYNRARMLNPPLGRFMQVDPLGYVDSTNCYQVEKSSTIDLCDPSGRGVVDCPKALAKLWWASVKLELRIAEAVDLDAGHIKAMKQAMREVEDAADKVGKHCGCYAGAAAAVAGAKALVDEAKPLVDQAEELIREWQEAGEPIP